MADSPTKFPFTESRIRNLKPGPTRYYVADSKVRGLEVLVYESGVRSFLSHRWVHGRASRIFHGRFPDLTVAQARKLAEQANAAIALGRDPGEEQRQAKLQGMLAELFETYMRLHSRPTKRPSSVREDENVWRRYLKNWRCSSMRLDTITRRDIETLQVKIKDEHGLFASNRAIALLSGMLVKAVHWGMLAVNHCAGVSKFSEKEFARKRFVTEDEMPVLRRALEAQGDQDFSDYIWLSLLCGQRSSNTLGMAWSQLDLDAAVWRIPGTEFKNREPLEVPLVALALAILVRRRKAITGPWVFPSPKTTGHNTSFRVQWDELMRVTGFKDLRPHDLRRTCGSWLSEAGAQLPVIASALGHRDLKTTAIYARSEVKKVRAALDVVATRMLPGSE